MYGEKHCAGSACRKIVNYAWPRGCTWQIAIPDSFSGREYRQKSEAKPHSTGIRAIFAKISRLSRHFFLQSLLTPLPANSNVSRTQHEGVRSVTELVVIVGEWRMGR